MCEVQFLFSSIIFVNQVCCIILSIAVAIAIVNIVASVTIKTHQYYYPLVLSLLKYR